MSKEVNDTNSDATSTPVVEETTAYVDPFDMILEALETPDTSQPTLEEVVEEDAEDQEDPTELDEEEVESEEEAVQDDADDQVEDEVLEEDEVLDELDDETDDDATSEEDEESEEEGEDVWFYAGHHSEYKTAELAKKGLEAKDAYIIDLEAAHDELKTSLATTRQKLTAYSSTISEEAITKAAVMALMPEKFQGKSDDDFEDDAELREFWKANVVAEEKFKAQQAKDLRAAEEAEEARTAKIKQSAKYVRDIATTEYFGVRNPEERNTLRKVLTEKDEQGNTPLDRARMIVEVFGESEGLIYLEGLRLQIQGEDEPVSTTSNSKKKTKSKKTVVTKKVPPKKVVQRVQKTRVKKKARIIPPQKNKAKDEYAGVDAVDMISAGLS